MFAPCILDITVDHRRAIWKDVGRATKKLNGRERSEVGWATPQEISTQIYRHECFLIVIDLRLVRGLLSDPIAKYRALVDGALGIKLAGEPRSTDHVDGLAVGRDDVGNSPI